MTAAPPDADTPPPGWPHTPAQWRVARRFAAGYSQRDIARELGLSRHTVVMHLRHLRLRVDGPADWTPKRRIVHLVDTLNRAA